MFLLFSIAWLDHSHLLGLTLSTPLLKRKPQTPNGVIYAESPNRRLIPNLIAVFNLPQKYCLNWSLRDFLDQGHQELSPSYQR